MFEIVAAGLQSSIQDLGRTGLSSAGLPQCGVLDPWAMQAVNLLVGNAREAPVLEVAGHQFSAICHSPATLAVACYNATIMLTTTTGINRPVNPWQMINVNPGDQLCIQSKSWSERCFIATRGGFKGDSYFDSVSTDTRTKLGGHQGRFLRQGDTLEFDHKQSHYLFKPPALSHSPLARPLTLNHQLRAIAGPELSRYSAEIVDQFWQTPWKIASQSNRMGCQLQGPTLTNNDQGSVFSDDSLRSHAVLPGTVQLPPGGLPIVLLADAQTTGGYPKIAKIIDADLWKLAHLPVDSELSLVQCSALTAIQALKENTRHLYKLELALRRFYNAGFNPVK